MYPAVKEVQALEDYRLRLVFENGETGILDMKPFLSWGVLERLKDEELFRRVRVSFDTVQWECGIDLDPEFIYAKCLKHAIAKPPGNTLAE